MTPERLNEIREKLKASWWDDWVPIAEELVDEVDRLTKELERFERVRQMAEVVANTEFYAKMQQMKVSNDD